jgi:glycosyltransferase involved in cell wall biosynthesis
MSRHQPKVLFFSTAVTNQSGSSYALRETVRRVEASGVKSLLVVPNSLGSRQMFPKNEFNVIYLEMRRPRRTYNLLALGRYFLFFPITLFALVRIIRQENCDLVHFNEITDFIAGLAAKFCGVSCVCHVRHDGIPQPHRWLLLLMLKGTVQAIVVPSRSTAAWIASERSDLANRIKLIYDYAFDVNEYSPSISGKDFRAELGIDEDVVLVVLVSKLVTIKGHHCFIRAAAKALSTSKGKMCFVVVGGEVPGHETEAREIESLASTLIAGDGLRFVGSRSDLPVVYAACDIAVHCPIYPDPYPTVVLLPMLVGKPVIGSNIGGIPEQIEHGENGVLVPPNDSNALASAIIDLSDDTMRRQKLGIAAMRKILKELAPHTQGQLLANLYASVLSGEHDNRQAIFEPGGEGSTT